jgi:hypothetical protein
MTTSAPSVPTIPSPRPTRPRRTGVPNSGWGMGKSAWTGIPRSTFPIPSLTRERSRLLWVAILSIPSWLLALLHAVYAPRVTGVMIFDMGLVQAMTWFGLFVACLTAGAFILTMVAKLRSSVSVKTQRIMWVMTALSLAGWVYIWVSLSLMVPLPPLLPF